MHRVCQGNALCLAPSALPKPPHHSRPMGNSSSSPGPPRLEFFSWRWAREQQMPAEQEKKSLPALAGWRIWHRLATAAFAALVPQCP